MKTRNFPILLGIALLAACQSGGGAAPTGQVVAKVNGEEITVADLHQEMDSLKANGHPGAGLQADALQAIVTRKQIAAEARKLKLDLVPVTALKQKKMDEMVLVEALTEQTRLSVPPPSREEAAQYVDEHPASFAQRKLFVLDQMIVLDNSPELLKKMEPLNTLTEIEALLNDQKIKYNKTIGVVDALNINADAAEKMAALPLGAVFISPDENKNLRVNVIRDAATVPLEREAAIKVALEALKARRADQMVSNRIGQILTDGAANVEYNASFAPKKAGGQGTGK
ncbi:MAG: hypothetical protein AB7U35_10995 [Sphingobium sp.]